jgi:hypothetical protein
LRRVDVRGEAHKRELDRVPLGRSFRPTASTRRFDAARHILRANPRNVGIIDAPEDITLLHCAVTFEVATGDVHSAERALVSRVAPRPQLEAEWRSSIKRHFDHFDEGIATTAFYSVWWWW